MKKFLALVLILGMASMANAALTLQTHDDIEQQWVDAVSSEIWLQPSETIWLGVHNDGQDASQNQISVGLFIYGPGQWTGNTSVFEEYAGPGAYWYVVGATYAYAFAGPPITYTLPPGVGLDLEFHCTDFGDVIIDLVDLGGGPGDQLIIHQIPEPMTMALLGLGGLALIRRRR
jgi:hypothetical protein